MSDLWRVSFCGATTMHRGVFSWLEVRVLVAFQAQAEIESNRIESPRRYLSLCCVDGCLTLFQHSPFQAKAMASSSAEVDISLDDDALHLQSTTTNAPTDHQQQQEPSNPTMDATKDDEEPDIGPIFPDHYYGGGKIPVFKPNMDQFRSFYKFIKKIDHYGMRSGIVKVIPPKEWIDSLPPLDEKVKEIKIKNPIEQHIAGSTGSSGTGIFKQENLQRQKSYNLPQWRNLCDSSDHQPPARRGERRKNQDFKPKPKPKPTRTTRRSTTAAAEDSSEPSQRPLTPPPGDETPVAGTPSKDEEDVVEVTAPGSNKKKRGRQPQAKPKRVYVRKTKEEMEEAAAEAAEIWNGFDYRFPAAKEFTQERCEELEKHYWRTLTYNSPLYGADMPGSLFDETTTSWNVAKLENILDCLGAKLPGVNTAYLYLGMWKATFSWHLEDVDLYSINYIHFGAPKQWYSISQDDAPRFHSAMKSIWPGEAKKCDQFLRHKTFLASPSFLESHHGIKVNKLVHHEGEFVITFPYGYHAGYNLGYNCAESVNFATEAWLEYGRKSKKCECIDDAVWVDADEIERKLKGLPTEDEWSSEEEEEDTDSDDDEEPTDLPTPPESVEGDGTKKPKRPRSSTKRKTEGEGGRMVKKIKVKFGPPKAPPCVLCPNEAKHEELLSTEEGKKAHRLCAMYIPETFFTTDPETNEERISNVPAIPTARSNLKCFYCRAKGGACFQCSETKCVRAYHPTCAAQAGVLVRDLVLPTKSDEPDQPPTAPRTELDFRCRFHRPKRPKDHTPEVLEEDENIMDFAKNLRPGQVVQFQLYLGEICAGIVRQNRASEHMLLLEMLPRGNSFELEWKYALPAAIMNTAPATKPKKSRASVPSVRTDGKGKRVAVEPRKTDFYADKPLAGDQFFPETTKFTWQEFLNFAVPRNPFQEPAVKIWYYVGEQSTENIPAWTKDPTIRVSDKDAVEPHLQRRSGTGDGPCYMTQAEERVKAEAVMAAQQRTGYYQPLQAQQPGGQAGGPNGKAVPQPFHTPNWRQPQPAPAQPAGPIASTSSGQRFVVASANNGRRVFYSPLQPTTYQSYQGTTHRVSYKSPMASSSAGPLGAKSTPPVNSSGSPVPPLGSSQGPNPYPSNASASTPSRPAQQSRATPS
ncbi:hypothetical protein TWF481_008029 [Arthrobotrys musiformis]|uniref:[histone H3]-trimethyl-L-lysine(9) demethylase n=1 Tax=Arthrobotrys musiformis TaxID=47236 RepID=A0AAV9WBP4_9PEZI